MEESKTTKAKVVNPNQTVTQQDMSDSRIEEILAEKMSKMEANSVLLGVVVGKVSKYDGKQKIDANGQPLFNPDNSPQKWADSHYVEITFLGGKDNIKVSEEIAVNLEVGKRYVATGRVKMVTPTEGKAYTTIEYDGFDKLF